MTNIIPEKIENLEIVEKAKGDVLVGGLGLGMIIIPIMNKPEVTSIDIVELSGEIIELVTSMVKFNDKVRIINCDISKFNPKGKKYDTIWLDTVDESLCSDKEYIQRSRDGLFLRDDQLSQEFKKWLTKTGKSYFYDPLWVKRQDLKQETNGIDQFKFKKIIKEKDSHTIIAINPNTKEKLSVCLFNSISKELLDILSSNLFAFFKGSKIPYDHYR